MELERNKAGKLQVARRKFTLEFKAEVVRHKRAENLTLLETGRKFDVLPKLVQRWEEQYAAGELTQEAGRRSVSPEQAELTRMKSELSRLKMENAILKKAAAYFARESL
jgi:transposase